MENQFCDLAQNLTEDEKSAAVLEIESEEYGVILAYTAQVKGTSLTMDNLEESMKMQWCITKGAKESQN